MAGGCISEYTSRRCCFNKCKYWKRDDSNRELSDYTNELNPSGVFFAKESSAQTKQKNIVGGMFMFDQNFITIETKDNVSIESGDVVEYLNEIWLVANVQEKLNYKSKQYMKKGYKTTYIQIKK